MISNRSRVHRNLSRILLGGAVALSVLSCQTDPDPVDVPQRVTMRFSDDVSYRQPDSASWEFKGKTGPTVFGAKQGTDIFTASFEVPSTPGSDTVHLSCWRYGIRSYVVPGIGSGDLTVVGEKVVRDSLSQDVFKRHVLDAAEEGDFFTESAQGVRRTYARMLVERDTLVKGYPARRPYGIDSSALVDEICVAMVRAGRPFDSLYSSSALGGDRTVWVSMVQARVASKLLTSQDSLALFPPPPVRSVKPISVVRDLVAGGDESGIEGAFAWDSGMVVLDAEILKAGEVVKGLVDVAVWQPQSNSEDEWNLDGRASIRARSKTAAGEYELRITARDAKGNSAVSSAGFAVSDPPAGVPRVAVLEPSGSDTIRLPFGKESIHVVARVRNPSEVKSETFTIGGAKARKEDDSTWSADVVVPPTGGAVIVGVRVEGTNGVVGSEYFLAVRAKDSQAPEFERATGAIDAVVPFDTTSAYVSWTVSDNHQLAGVTIAGVAAVSLGNTWWSRVPLAVGKNVVRMEAVDSTGNKSVDSIAIARAKDLQAPHIVALEGTESQELVGDADLSVLVNWNVTDNHRVAKVEIAGEPAVHAGASDVWFRYVVVKEGDNKIVVRAWDSTGNESADSIEIHKSVNPDHPVLKALTGTYTRTVDFETASIELGWQVLNPKCLGEVKIAGEKTSGDDGRFLRAIDLPIGDTQVVVVATDTLGHVSKTSVKITRKRDTIAPVCMAGPRTATIIDGKIRATVSWVVTDNHKLSSVEIEGVEATSVGNLFGRTVDVPLDQKWIRMVATDSCGNQKRDSMLIDGAPDTLAPVIYAGAGANNRTVEADVAQTLVSWMVVDDRDVTRVEIAGKVVEPVGTLYGRSVELATGKNTIRVGAEDAAGNKDSSEVVIYRKDANGPKISVKQGPPSDSVGEAIEAIDLFFEVEDPQGVQSVTIDGKEVPGSAGVYTKNIPLAFGKNSIEILAKDVDGALSPMIIDVFRRDETAPAVKRKFDASIPLSVSEYELEWDVSDNSGAFTATLDGKPIACADGICKATVPLAVGSNTFVFEAKDAANGKTTDAPEILRKDESAPEVKMVAPVDPSQPIVVGDANPKAVLKWTASDNVGVVSCTAGGEVVVKNDAGEYLLEIDMTGKFTDSVVTIVANDVEKNVSKPTVVTVHHADIVAPAIAMVAPAPPTTILGATDAAPKAVVRWKVSDNSGIFTTTANDKKIDKSVSGEFAFEVDMTGRYTDSVVVIAAKDAAGNAATSISVAVRHADETAPILTAVEPVAADGMVWVKAGETSALVKWIATDAVGPVECTVNKTKVVGDASGMFSVSIDMANKVDDSVLKIVGTDKAGNPSKELGATVRRDIQKPVVTKINPTPATPVEALAAGITTFTVKWSVADAGGLASTTINGVEFAAKAVGDYSLPVDMSGKDGDSAIWIVAKDIAGNVSDTTKFAIRRDVTKPKVAKTNPGALVDTVWFGSAGTTFEVKWSVEDPGLSTVTINRDAVVASGTVYSRSVDMKNKTTDSTVWLVATDLAGNRSDTSKVVLRFDVVKPKVVKVDPVPALSVVPLGISPATYLVKWTATDANGILSSTLNGTAGTAGASNGYSKIVDMSGKTGDSLIKLEAKDKAGNASTLVQFKIHRDVSAPTISVYAGSATGVFPKGTASTSLSWKVADDEAVASVMIDGSATSFASGLVSRLFTLGPGRNVFRIEVKDAAGNVAKDSAVYVVAGTNAQIAAGGYFGLYLDESGAVTSWGSEFTLPSGLGVVKEIAAAGRLALFLKSDGSVVSVGSGSFSAPAPPPLSGVKHVFAGTLGLNSGVIDDVTGIAIKGDDSWVLWGASVGKSYVKSAIANEPKAIKVVVGNGFIIVHRPDSTAVSWSASGGGLSVEHGKARSVVGGYDNGYVLLGDGTVVKVAQGAAITTPASPPRLAKLAAGYLTSVGIDNYGNASNWGNEYYGAIPVAFPSDVVDVGAGYRWSMVLASNGKVLAWGQDVSVDVPSSIAWTP